MKGKEGQLQYSIDRQWVFLVKQVQKDQIFAFFCLSLADSHDESR